MRFWHTNSWHTYSPTSLCNNYDVQNPLNLTEGLNRLAHLGHLLLNLSCQIIHVSAIYSASLSLLSITFYFTTCGVLSILFIAEAHFHFYIYLFPIFVMKYVFVLEIVYSENCLVLLSSPSYYLFLTLKCFWLDRKMLLLT